MDQTWENMDQTRKPLLSRRRLGAAFLGLCAPGALAAPALLSSPAALAQSPGAAGTVALLLPDNVISRWEQQDRVFFENAMKVENPRAKVVVFNALGDPAKQVAQAEAALTQDAKVLVVIAQDTTAAASIVRAAHQQKVPVIAYARMIPGADVDYFVGKDSVQVGREQGKWLAANTKDGDTIVLLNGSPDDGNAHLFNQGYTSVLNPLFSSGRRKLGGDLWIQGYDPAKAQAAMEQLLTKNNNQVQGVLAANDGIAGGAASALRERGLDLPITGLDATLAGVQRVMLGKQGMTIMQPVADFAKAAAKLSNLILGGQTPPDSLFGQSTPDKTKSVPTIQIPTVPIVKANVSEVVKAGMYTQAQLCQGIPASTGGC
jgi:D-xylose transport system substrate-binding protein